MSNRSRDAPAEQGRAETFDRGFSHAPHRERVSRVREMPGPHGNHDRGPMRRQDYAKSMMRWSLSYPHVQGLGTGWYRYSRHPQGSSGWACAVGAAYAASPRRGRAGRACPSNCVESSGGLDAVGPDRSVDEQATSMSAPTLKKHRACLPRLMTRIFVFTADLSRGPVVAKTGHCVVPLRPAPGRASSMKFVLA